MDEIKPSGRLREPTKEDVHNIAKIRELCTEWGKDAENYINRYLNITAQGGVLSRDLDRTVQILADYLICRDSGPAKPQQTSLSVERAARVPSPKMTGPATLGVYQEPTKLVGAASIKQKPKPIAAPALDPCSVEELKAAFTAQRSSRKMTYSDVAGILGVSAALVQKAESAREPLWSGYFLSQKVIDAYSGTGDAAKAGQLERQAFAAVFPKGIKTLADLVSCIANRQGKSMKEYGSQCGFTNLASKINPKSNREPNVLEQLKLRELLLKDMAPLGHLGISSETLDQLMPDPIVFAHQGNFKDVLKVWAELACTSKAQFVCEVGKIIGNEKLADSSLYFWAEGTGLSNNLESIIQVLKTNPNTKDMFPEYEQRFRDLAATVMKKPRYPREDAGATHAQRVQMPRAVDDLGR